MTEAGHGGASPDVARVLWRHYVMITTLISIDFIHGHLFICLCLFIYLLFLYLLILLMKALGICSSFAIVSFECPFDEARQTGRGAPDGGEDGGCGPRRLGEEGSWRRWLGGLALRGASHKKRTYARTSRSPELDIHGGQY